MIDDLDKTKVTSSARVVEDPSVEDTVAAISTPPGPGAVGVVRISGPAACDIGVRVFTPIVGRWPDSPPHRPPARQALFGHVHPFDDPSSPIDQAVWLLFASPRSYTGEDTVEITVHGGPLILAELLGAVISAGARLAEPGEFTRRAYLNGRLDLSQAEAVASLIFAGTSRARRVMLGQVEGAMGREAAAVRQALLDTKVILETAIDFPEDVEEGELSGPQELLEGAADTAARLLATSRQGIALKEGLKVVIVGAPNVGKSSLLNALMEEDRAIVHEVAGTTRDFIEGRISIQGIPMVVMDTAGIRGDVLSVEAEGIRKTHQLMEGADLLLVVLDSSRALLEDETRLLEGTEGLARVVVANKSDLADCHSDNLPVDTVVASALTGQGLDELKRALHSAYVGEGPALEESGGIVISLRQADALTKILDGCRQAMDGAAAGDAPELVAVGVDEALAGVGELTGEVTTDEVLNTIFERFCIGK